MRVLLVTLLLIVAGCASVPGERSTGNAEFINPGRVAKPGGLLEADLPIAGTCGRGQLLVCNADSGGNACSCADMQYLQRSMGMYDRSRRN